MRQVRRQVAFGEPGCGRNPDHHARPARRVYVPRLKQGLHHHLGGQMPEQANKLNSRDLTAATRLMRLSIEELPELMVELGMTEGFLEGEATVALRKLERMADEAAAAAAAAAAEAVGA